jgi:hypothetical protein
MNSLRACVALFAFAATAAAQCAFTTLVPTAIAPGCNPVIGTTTPGLRSSLSARSCQIELLAEVLIGRPSDQPIARALVLGASRAPLALPMVGPGCVLQPAADVCILQPVMSGAYLVALPNRPLPPLTLYAQAAILYDVTGTNRQFWSLSEALALALQ